MRWWDAVVSYYKTIGEKYSVDPFIFAGIHVIATPLFAAAVWWIIYAKKRKQSLVLPVLVATFVFNAANLYLVIFGEGIPWWIYAVLLTTTLISGYFTVRKIKKRMAGTE